MSELVLERNDEIPKDWKLIPLGEISNVVRGASPRPAGSPIFFGGSIPWITVKFLTADENPYLFSTNETVTKAGKSKSRYVQPDTLLITNSGATLGVPKIIKIGGCINDGIVAIEEVSYPLKKYLYYYLLSLTKKLRMINQGAAQPNLNTSIIKSILIPLPPLNEQKRIVEKIEELFSKLDNAKRILENTIYKLKTKKQSFLNFALVGKLTNKSPSLAV